MFLFYFFFTWLFSPSVNYVFSENSADTYARVIVIPSLLESTVIKSDCHRTTILFFVSVSRNAHNNLSILILSILHIVHAR